MRSSPGSKPRWRRDRRWLPTICAQAGLQKPISTSSGFNLVGYGCTTCIGNSGPLPAEFASAIEDNDLVVAAVLSGNRNFEGRVSPHVQANYLASPPLVVAYALAERGDRSDQRAARHWQRRQTGLSERHLAVSNEEIAEIHRRQRDPEMFRALCAMCLRATPDWRKVKVAGGQTYDWDDGLDLCPEPALFRRHCKNAEAVADIIGGADSGSVRRHDHHRPYFAGRQYQGDSPGRRYLSSGRSRRPISIRMARGAAITK